jgi:hypothetical protein
MRSFWRKLNGLGAMLVSRRFADSRLAVGEEQTARLDEAIATQQPAASWQGSTIPDTLRELRLSHEARIRRLGEDGGSDTQTS